MNSPLVSRPAYGYGRAAIPVSESKLPKGDPGGKGLSLDPGIPGQSTFAKPSEEGPREPRTDDESIHRVDHADDLLKDQSKTDQTDWSDLSPAYNLPGEPDPDARTKTKYPYRDDIPNAHNASAEFVAEVFLLRTAHELVIHPSPMSRTAATLGEMTQGLDPKTLDKSASCSVTMKRADIPNLRWLFAVNCGNGAKVVRIKAAREGNIVKFSKLDLVVSCSCPAWQWTGPEHHAKREGYLDGKQVGTASTPVIRDPENHHTVCKHVAATLSFTKGWSVPKKG